ncbi:unnamed protein product [Chondrus crispus]|uniref:Uncharacterized protein n=1 Tax=Chondrus crispus TaxID=2769 RepID=R7QC54_CHOCR|nr:unnamed protein product [Chondrus crispus]CDF36082.1 unnamed protein product [Chondrus crispus]|eukprot:XP_005715901.1 unnamed protein product [Chondrus crispus]
MWRLHTPFCDVMCDVQICTVIGCCNAFLHQPRNPWSLIASRGPLLSNGPIAVRARPPSHASRFSGFFPHQTFFPHFSLTSPLVQTHHPLLTNPALPHPPACLTHPRAPHRPCSLPHLFFAFLFVYPCHSSQITFLHSFRLCLSTFSVSYLRPAILGAHTLSRPRRLVSALGFTFFATLRL